MVSAIGVAAFAQEEDPLDAKLNALKEKAQRRSYSTAAVLNNQELAVPQEVSDEEKALDDKIRAMEKKLDSQPISATPQMSMQRFAARPRPVQEKSSNWLTPALLNESDAENSASTEDDDSWVLAEITRQKQLQQTRLAEKEEKQLINQQLREALQTERAASRSSADDYNTSLKSMFSGRSSSSADSKTSAGSFRSPFSINRTSEPSASGPVGLQRSITPSSSSFGAAQQPASTLRRSSSSSATQLPGLTIGSSTPSPFRQTQSWRTPESAPLSPRQKMRRSSNRANPFDDNAIPSVKSSIWD